MATPTRLFTDTTDDSLRLFVLDFDIIVLICYKEVGFQEDC